MSKKITIAIDAMGGENSPEKTIKGVGIFLKKNLSADDFTLKLFGDIETIEKNISKFNIDKKNLELIHATSTVSDEESPLTAIKNSRNTSMWKCINSQLDGSSNISLSAGNTGVLLVISKMILKMIKKLVDQLWLDFGLIRKV